MKLNSPHVPGTVLLLVFFFVIVSCLESAAQRFAVASGNWNNAIWASTSNGTPGSASVPSSSTDVTINAGVTVTVTASAAARSLTVNGTLNVTGNNVTIANGGFVTNNTGGSIVFSSSHRIRGGSSGNSRVLLTVQAGSNLTTANSGGFGGFVRSNTSLTGSFGINPGSNAANVSFSPLANYHYNGTSNQQLGTAVTAANNITFSNGGTRAKTPAGPLTINGTFTVNNGATFNGLTHSHTFNGNLVNNGTLTLSGTTRLSGTADQLISGTSLVVFQSINILKPGSVLRTSTNITASGTITVGTGSVLAPAATQTIGGTGTLTGTGTVRISRLGNAVNLLQQQYPITNRNLSQLIIDYSGTGVQVVPAGSYNNLIVSGNGVKSLNGNITIGALAIEAGSVLNAGTFRISALPVFTTSGTGLLRVESAATDALPDDRLWSFAIEYAGTQAQTISRGIFNGGVIVTNAAGVLLKGPTTMAGLTLSAGNLQLNNTSLTLNGAFNGSASNALWGSRMSDLTIGAQAGTLYFHNSGTGNVLRRLQLQAGASATLGNTLNITSGTEAGTVTVTSSSKLYSNGHLVLQSDAAGTARVAEIAGCVTCTAIEGEVVVERYLPAKRTWRMLTVPVTGNYTLRQQLTRQGPGTDGTAAEYPAPWCNTGPAPAASGYGTIITAHSMSSCTNAAQVGADHLVNGSASSVRRYTHINGVGSWASNTNTPLFNTVPAEDGYLVFVRGDRSVLNSGATATTIRFKGFIRQGRTATTNAITTGYAVMSNPYAAPIHLDRIMNNSEGNDQRFERNFWIWDGDKTAGANSLGGYRSISYDGQGGYDCADCENTTAEELLNVNSGQAFMVQRKLGVTTPVRMTLTETDKLPSGGNAAFFRNQRVGSTAPRIRIQLHRATGAVPEAFVDGALVRYGAMYAAGTNEAFDVYKYNNMEENISLVRSNSYLSIESRPLPQSTDTLFLPFWNVTNRGYALQVELEQFATTGLAAVLVDQFTNSRISLPTTGGAFVYPFTVTPAAGSRSLSRFRIELGPTATLPVNFTAIRASARANGVQVEWEVAEESDLEVYEIERSTDGRSFNKLATQAPSATGGSATYQWLDANPVKGANLYRIKAVDKDGSLRYSGVVRVNLQAGVDGVKVYPTVVTQQKITVEINQQPAGLYQVRLSSLMGQVLHNAQLNHGGGSSSQQLTLGQQVLPPGTYYLTIEDGAGGKTTTKLILQ